MHIAWPIIGILALFVIVKNFIIGFNQGVHPERYGLEAKFVRRGLAPGDPQSGQKRIGH